HDPTHVGAGVLGRYNLQGAGAPARASASTPVVAVGRKDWPMSRRARVPVRDRINQKLRRTWKFAARRVRSLSTGRRQDANAIFVLGSGRSGTRVPLVVLERSPETITYSEGHSRLFRGALLREDRV